MGRGVILLIVCAVLMAAVIVTRPWEAQTEPDARDGAESSLTFMPTREPRSQPPAGDGRTVSLGEANVLLRYPEGYALGVDGERLDDPEAAQACGEGFEYCVYPLGGGGEGGRAGVTVSHREDLGSEADCILDPTDRFADQLPTVGGGGDHATANFGWLQSQTAGGHEGTGLRRLYIGGYCFEFLTNFLADSVGQATALRDELSAILEDVALPDGRTGLWSPGR